MYIYLNESEVQDDAPLGSKSPAPIRQQIQKIKVLHCSTVQTTKMTICA